MQSISRNARPMLLITYKKFILSLNRLEILSGEWLIATSWSSLRRVCKESVKTYWRPPQTATKRKWMRPKGNSLVEPATKVTARNFWNQSLQKRRSPNTIMRCSSMSRSHTTTIACILLTHSHILWLRWPSWSWIRSSRFNLCHPKMRKLSRKMKMVMRAPKIQKRLNSVFLRSLSHRIKVKCRERKEVHQVGRKTVVPLRYLPNAFSTKEK